MNKIGWINQKYLKNLPYHGFFLPFPLSPPQPTPHAAPSFKPNNALSNPPQIETEKQQEIQSAIAGENGRGREGR